MNIGLWITPALMAGVCAVVWVTTRLERVVSGPAVDAEAEMPEFVDTEFRPALPIPVPGRNVPVGVCVGGVHG